MSHDMNTAPRSPLTTVSPSIAPGRDVAPRRVDLATILQDDREIIICHANEEYRLRLTSNNKLLLTK
jgi:hemin uptake protein HemP